MNLGIPFLSEDELKLDYHKTPDALLKLPISVDGVTINWIESKVDLIWSNPFLPWQASFGDETSHIQNSEQFWGYRSRCVSTQMVHIKQH